MIFYGWFQFVSVVLLSTLFYKGFYMTDFQLCFEFERFAEIDELFRIFMASDVARFEDVSAGLVGQGRDIMRVLAARDLALEHKAGAVWE